MRHFAVPVTVAFPLIEEEAASEYIRIVRNTTLPFLVCPCCEGTGTHRRRTHPLAPVEEFDCGTCQAGVIIWWDFN